jgi:NitT/TauT family transport system substrate-binding protein
LILMLAVVLAGSVFPTGTGAAEETSEVIYRLKWLFNVSVIGDVYANANGLFADEGLTVEVKAGGPERDAIKELELGHSQFGVASGDQVVRARAKGSPVVVIAQLFQVNPLQWIYRPARNRIGRLEDLRGKTLGVTFGGNDETILRALLTKGGIREHEVTFFSVRYDYTPFYRGKVDLWPVYRNAEGVIIERKLGGAGEGSAFFDPAGFGVKFVANSVVTSERILEDRPELVDRFLRALLRGWTIALDPKHEKEALETLHAVDRETSLPVLKAQLQITRRLIRPTPGFQIGTIDIAAWKQTETIMLAQKLIPAPVSVEAALRPGRIR